VEVAVEIVLEFEEIVRLLKKALKSEGIAIPPESKARVRSNHKLGTIRVVFKTG
jgi:hypothetical protein